MKFLFT